MDGASAFAMVGAMRLAFGFVCIELLFVWGSAKTSKVQLSPLGNNERRHRNVYNYVLSAKLKLFNAAIAGCTLHRELYVACLQH